MTQASLWAEPVAEEIGPGAVLLRGFASDTAADMLTAIEALARVAPFRHMEVPGGHAMSVAMTNAGALGWVSDRTGYRYDACDPVTGLPWPPVPEIVREVGGRAAQAAGITGFAPESCLINRYAPGARMGLHQDRNERCLDTPIVSVSLGSTATFLWGGQRRQDPVRRYRLHSGDVVVWGGPSRLAYHGIAPLPRAHDPVAGEFRYNLTLRQAG